MKNLLALAILAVCVQGSAAHINWSEIHQSLDKNCKASKDPVCVGHEILYALEKSSTGGGGGGGFGALNCTCDEWGYLRCSRFNGGETKSTPAIDLGTKNECTEVKSITERKGVACDDWGYIYRLDYNKTEFVKGEDLGSRSDCVTQIQ